ncbi:hypothetical protein T552_00295 [Pneumocystis carinii B80]|uniref:Uncharacterized protein n=1 Tax=Pneumocystis carinii (strain B80) TaxID=1408658 RepID=A0A0W4ZQF6_PNEC8|nr:hypothetical protein T552_00295 [Pneumocystis carinii B80]KTW30578.1 hypothetical protein T552_00295 [Pneumocystis carinii B80]
MLKVSLLEIIVREEEILAYILKEDHDDDDTCKEKFKEYCEELRDIDSELNEVYSKVKEISGNIEQKCKNPELKIHGKVDDLCNYIYLFMNTSITCKDCNEHIQKCLFLEFTKIHGIQTTSITLKNYIIYTSKKKRETKLFLELLALECQRIVLEKCATLENNNIEIFFRCLLPKEICLRLEKNILTQLKDLEQVLNAVQDYPKEKDCVELKENCEGILKDLGLNNEKCVTLKERYEYFKVTKELKHVFLKEESDILANNQKCMKDFLYISIICI